MARYNPVQTSQMPAGEKIAQRLWEVLRVVLCRSTPFFMRGWRRVVTIAFAHLYPGVGRIAGNVSFARTCSVDYPWRLSIAEQSSIGDGAWVYALDRITIGKNVCIGEDVRLLTGSHDITSPHFDLITKPISVHDNVWIATGAIILPGVTIGEGAVVAAGAVVAKDVEPWTVVGGVPAKFMKKRILRAC